MRTKLVAGNWKMHGRREMVASLVPTLVSRLPQGPEVAVCVPFVYLSDTQAAIGGARLQLGAQDVSECEDGAFTGEISAGMLNEMGCRYVIVGHSERRARHAESSQRVAEKAAAALRAGMTPIVCVGETREERLSGRTATVIAAQLAPVLALGASLVERLVIAYEPVWAIGTGLSASVAEAAEVHADIRAALAKVSAAAAKTVRILYGGSVKPETAPALFAVDDIDGGLIGGAALDAEAFLAICNAAVVV
ncbi:triose-phosphate isomerase [Denitromonas iodatirespirans]|uniref:Triosephosphate isomerase n=1 Tax=Denitromonas iodatirespirans TaxID=2795389 RepID=A0A944DCN7_DENI1|nr:triose-phosphate isomerase [Denitromonas iodatirespirans]MBT0963800.1 triose-phosphate isomerase [Denitromonas iodatirespirans]